MYSTAHAYCSPYIFKLLFLLSFFSFLFSCSLYIAVYTWLSYLTESSGLLRTFTLIVRNLVAYSKDHIYPHYKINIYSSITSRILFICSCVGLWIISRFSSILVRFLNYQVYNFWRIVYSKQHDKVVGGDIL
jgi:hypothetical protein